MKNLLKKYTKTEKSWILYDVANSAYILAITAIIPIYFSSLAKNSGISESIATSYWGFATSISIIIIALLSPILGAIADFEGKKKKFFIFFLILGILFLSLLIFSNDWLSFLVLIVLSRLCYTATNVFYDSMITDVTTDENVDLISSHGYAWGYIGSCIPFCIGVFLIVALPFGLNTTTAIKIYILLTALWWLLLTLPLIKNVRQIYYKNHEANYIKNSCKQLINTLKDIKNHKQLMWFILSYFFYIDGVNTIISMATSYGVALNINSTGLILALLVTQIVAFPASIISGILAKKYSNSAFIKFSILVYSLICVFGFFLSNVLEFFILAILVGLFQGGIQALSRSHFSKLIPKNKSSEYFGFFSVFGKFAEILGPLLISLSVIIFKVPNYGLLFLISLFLLGFIFFKHSEKFKNS